MIQEEMQKKWYEEYQRETGENRNDLRKNPGVMFQVLAMERSFILAERAIPYEPSKAAVLDVGCGAGGNIYQLLRLGYLPENITGIEIQSNLVEDARKMYPSAHFLHGDASKMPFADQTFDLVMESTMFATLTDDSVSQMIASEMVRVCKKGGYILLVDWRIPKPGDARYKALTMARLSKMLNIKKDVSLMKICKGALVPPIGRFLSKYLPATYFPLAAAFPFLVGQVVYLFRKND